MGDVSTASELGEGLYRPLIVCALIALSLAPFLDLTATTNNIRQALDALVTRGGAEPDKALLVRVGIVAAAAFALPSLFLFASQLNPLYLFVSPDNALGNTAVARNELAQLWCAHPNFAEKQQLLDFVLDYPLPSASEQIVANYSAQVTQGKFDVDVARSMLVVFLIGGFIALKWRSLGKFSPAMFACFALLGCLIAYSGFSTEMSGLRFWRDAQVRLVHLDEMRQDAVQLDASCVNARVIMLAEDSQPEYRVGFRSPTASAVLPEPKKD